MKMITYFQIITLTLLINFCDFIRASSKYNDCENLSPNQIKILESNKELKVWLGSEVSLTCCMKDSRKSSNLDLEDEFELVGNKNSEPLNWYDPNMNPIINYFTNPSKAQESGVFSIPETVQNFQDLQVVHLVIKNFSSSDNGLYKCDTVRNSRKSEEIYLKGNPKIIIDAEEYQFIEEGQTGYINCRPRGHPNIDIVWFFKGEYLSPDNHKYSFLQNHQTLRIAKITEEFGGKYLCKAEVSIAGQRDSSESGSFIEIQPIDVIVYQTPTLKDDSPEIKYHYKSQNKFNNFIIEDGILDISCDSDGLPPPIITWYRDNKQLNSSFDPRVNITESYYGRNAYSTLKIQPVRIQDIGVYTCNSSVSSHGFSKSVAKNIAPEFVFQPRILNMGTNLNASSLVGKDVVLNCSVFGAFSDRLEVAFIQEDYNNKTNVYTEDNIKPSIKFTKYQDSLNRYISHYQLTILGIQPYDAGWYHCRASIKSEDVHSVSNIGVLSVLYGPKILPSKSTIFGLWYKRNIIKCKAKGFPTPIWEWKFQDFPLSKQFNQYQIRLINNNDTSVSELTILPNYQNDAIFGTYQCNAVNQFGSDSNFISFTQAWQPGPPLVEVCKITASTIRLCVSPNADTGGLPLTHYEMRIKDFEVNKFFGPYYYPVNPSTITLSHLKSNMRYEIALSSASEAGRGPNTNVKVTTRHFGRPIIELVNTSAAPDYDAFNLQWIVDSDGGLPIFQYDVEIQEVKVNPDNGKIVERVGKLKTYVVRDLSQFKNMFRVNSLRPNTWYELKFTAKNLLGPSMIQEVVFRTLEMPPSLAGSARLRNPLGKSANYLRQSLRRNSLALLLIFMLRFQ